MKNDHNGLKLEAVKVCLKFEVRQTRATLITEDEYYAECIFYTEKGKVMSN